MHFRTCGTHKTCNFDTPRCDSSSQAFGNTVSPSVVLSLFPHTSWLVVIAEIMLVVHGAVSYQVTARGYLFGCG